MAVTYHGRRAPMNEHQLRAPRTLSCELLEERLAMYAATGSSWSSPNVSFSFVPDGSSSTLFSKLDAIAPRDVWQREFARALQTWANVSNLNFREVADSGTAGGDIRLSASALGGYLAYAYFPGGGIGGDITLATEHTFWVGADYDLYSVLLHEAGHSLGLNHTSGTVMNSYYQGILGGLTVDDIAGIRSIYGARSEDAFDASARNDSLSAATMLTLDSSGVKSFTADLTSLGDIDYFRVTAPTSSDGTLRVSVDSRDISLLQGRVLVYDASGNLIRSADATTYEGQAEVNLTGIAAGQTYYVVADGAIADAFGMGKYGLTIAFGGGSSPPTEPTPEPPPSGISADRHESNNTLDTAKNLGRLNSRTETGLTLHTSTDTDVFTFVAKTSGTFRVTTNYASAAGQHEIKIFDSQRNLISSSGTPSVDAALTGRQQYFVQIGSPSGTLDTYDLLLQKLGGNGLTTGALQFAPLGDGYFVDAAAAARGESDPGAYVQSIDDLLATWQPEHSSSGARMAGLGTKLPSAADWGVQTARTARTASKYTATTLPLPASSVAADRILERVTSGPRGQGLASEATEWTVDKALRESVLDLI